MCWVAADRGARLAEIRGELEHAALAVGRGRDPKDILENASTSAACSPSTTRTRSTPRCSDGADPLPAPKDERIRRTVLAIARGADRGRLVLRYRTDETDDGLSGEEGTFAICSFWLVSALVEIGECARRCDKLLSYASRSASTRRRSTPAPAVT